MPNYTAQADSKTRRQFPGAVSDWIFPEGASPVKGFYAMKNSFTSTEYPEPGIHEDHEGFYILRGTGMIQIGDAEYPANPGTAILVPAGMPHAIRKTSVTDLEIFIFHFAARE